MEPVLLGRKHRCSELKAANAVSWPGLMHSSTRVSIMLHSGLRINKSLQVSPLRIVGLEKSMAHHMSVTTRANWFKMNITVPNSQTPNKLQCDVYTLRSNYTTLKHMCGSFHHLIRSVLMGLTKT